MISQTVKPSNQRLSPVDYMDAQRIGRVLCMVRRARSAMQARYIVGSSILHAASDAGHATTRGCQCVSALLSVYGRICCVCSSYGTHAWHFRSQQGSVSVPACSPPRPATTVLTSQLKLCPTIGLRSFPKPHSPAPTRSSQQATGAAVGHHMPAVQAGWVEVGKDWHMGVHEGHPYWYNESTGTSSWTKPDELEAGTSQPPLHVPEIPTRAALAPSPHSEVHAACQAASAQNKLAPKPLEPLVQSTEQCSMCSGHEARIQTLEAMVNNLVQELRRTQARVQILEDVRSSVTPEPAPAALTTHQLPASAPGYFYRGRSGVSLLAALTDREVRHCFCKLRLKDVPKLRGACRRLWLVPLEDYMCPVFENTFADPGKFAELRRRQVLVDKFCCGRTRRTWPAHVLPIFLRARGCHVNFPEPHTGRTLFWKAANFSDKPIADALISASADVSIADSDGSTPLMEAAKLGCNRP